MTERERSVGGVNVGDTPCTVAVCRECPQTASVLSLFSASKTHTLPAETFSEAAPPLGPPVHTPSVWEALAQEDGEAHARDSA